jgi:malonyl CoA-acyl carrier protein transacylase
MGELAWKQYGAAKLVISETSDRIGVDLKEVCFKDGKLNYLQADPRIIQPAIVAVELAEYAAYKEHFGEADVVTGLSLGMYAALGAAGVFENYGDTVEVAAERAKIMHEVALNAGGGGMAGVVGMAKDRLDSIVHTAGAEYAVIRDRIANSFVITGTEEEVKQVETETEKEGRRRWVPLNISGMFHSRHQNESVEPFANVLSGFGLNDPTIHLLGNNAVYLATTFEATQHLLDQLEQTSDWDSVANKLAADGIKRVVELGPDYKRGLARQMVKNHGASAIEFPLAV